MTWRTRRDAEPPTLLLDFASEWLGRPALSADASVLVEVPLRPPAVGPYRLRVLPVAAGQPPCARSIASR